jgi:hypothetical protein
LLDLCIQDSSDQVLLEVEELMMPSMSLWALNLGILHENLIMHMLEKVEYHLIRKQQLKYGNNSTSNTNSNLGKLKPAEHSFEYEHERHASAYLNLLNLNLQFIFAFILIQFRDSHLPKPSQSSFIESTDHEAHQSDDENNENHNQSQLTIDEHLSKLNLYYHSLQEHMHFKYELYKLDSILDDYLNLTKKYLNMIESDSWSSIDLSNAFEWLSDKFLLKLIQMTAQIDAKDYLCAHFVQLFHNFVLLFSIDYELIKSKINPIFEKFLNITPNESEASQQNAIESLLNSKVCPLFKATLPVYFVGILSSLVDAEIHGWLSFNLDASADDSVKSLNLNSESSPSIFRKEKVINSSFGTESTKLKRNDEKSANSAPQVKESPIEQRISQMSNYLKNLFFTLSLNQSNMDGLVAIFEQMKSVISCFSYSIKRAT